MLLSGSVWSRCGALALKRALLPELDVCLPESLEPGYTLLNAEQNRPAQRSILRVGAAHQIMLYATFDKLITLADKAGTLVEVAEMALSVNNGLAIAQFVDITQNIIKQVCPDTAAVFVSE